MMGGGKVLGLIPARGGSKGVSRKNLRELAGKPLLAWTIEAGRKSRYLDRLVLSSDDPEIMETARRLGCDVPFARPAHLADDSSLAIEVVRHALEQLPGYQWVVLLQPTSPLRLASDIDACLERCAAAGAPSCVSVAPADKHPDWMFTLGEEDRLKCFVDGRTEINTRQELPPVFVLNGAVYVARLDWLLASGKFVGAGTIGYVMPEERSVDIDSEADLVVAEHFLQKRKP